MADFQAFSNRLLKNKKHTGKWARRAGISCYRVFDDDMPEFPLAIDLYDDAVHVAEYARNHSMLPDEHVAWLNACLQVISEVLEVQLHHIFLKFRQRQSGLQQYEIFARQGAEKLVSENGLMFVVNLSDYLDTGLFLDHRPTRQMVREQSEGKKVLNLFAYTGAFTVYAAAGGASETLTIDLSNTYQAWSKRNLKVNNLQGPQHRFVQADVMEWLHKAPKDELFDIVVCDPPTFSNSKRMYDVFDVQRDHVWMLNRIIERTAPGGTIWFSTNFRKFKPEWELVHCADIADVTKQTIPPDFRNERIHYCYRLRV